MLVWLAVILGVAVLGVAGSVLLSWRRPVLGVVDGRLRPCAATPNCVCSHAEDELHGVAPLIADDAPDAMNRVRQVMADWRGAKLTDEADGYVRYECATPLLRYTDDLEFLLDIDERVVHVRSASRVGHSDLGANRRRIEAIRGLYENGGGE